MLLFATPSLWRCLNNFNFQTRTVVRSTMVVGAAGAGGSAAAWTGAFIAAWKNSYEGHALWAANVAAICLRCCRLGDLHKAGGCLQATGSPTARFWKQPQALTSVAKQVPSQRLVVRPSDFTRPSSVTHKLFIRHIGTSNTYEWTAFKTIVNCAILESFQYFGFVIYPIGILIQPIS